MDNLGERFVVEKDGKFLAQGDFVVTFIGFGDYYWDHEFTSDPKLVHKFADEYEAQSFAYVMDGTSMLWEKD